MKATERTTGAHISWAICSVCQGTAEHQERGHRGERCPECRGGRVPPKDWREPVVESCSSCQGAGQIIKDIGSAAKWELTRRREHLRAQIEEIRSAGRDVPTRVLEQLEEVEAQLPDARAALRRATCGDRRAAAAADPQAESTSQAGG